MYTEYKFLNRENKNICVFHFILPTHSNIKFLVAYTIYNIYYVYNITHFICIYNYIHIWYEKVDITPQAQHTTTYTHTYYTYLLTYLTFDIIKPPRTDPSGFFFKRIPRDAKKMTAT